MHKSQSFFERIDDKEKSTGKQKGAEASSTTTASRTSGAGVSKQSKLSFGKKADLRGKGKEIDNQLGFSKPSGTSSAFVETQDLLSEESQDRIGNDDVEIASTLQSANEKEKKREYQGLEETQMEEDNSQLDETQPQDDDDDLPPVGSSE